ncbi:MAG TPA: lysylphosphatidylglycerol synthase transmembrane domain-containing protein [Chthoniobacterales bacterium]
MRAGESSRDFLLAGEGGIWPGLGRNRGFVVPMHQRWLLILLQTAVTAGLLAFFFHDPKFRADALTALGRADARWLALGIAFAGIENFLGAIRWRIFLRMLAIDVPFWKSVQVCLVALFCNTFLLGAAGGDLVRAAYLVRRGASKTDALLSVLMDRACGLAALIFYTVILGAWNYEWLTSNPRAALLFHGVLAYEAVCAVAVLGALVISARDLANRLPGWMPCREFLLRLAGGYAKLAHEWSASLRALALSLAMILAYFGVFFSAAKALGGNISFLHLATIMPIADVISSLPISIGGMGVREWVFIGLLGPLAAIPPAVAISISLVGYLLNTSWGLVGAAILPFYKGIVREARSTGDSVSARARGET